MNKILAISVLLGVTVMMMGSILPAMAEPLAQADDHVKGHVGQVTDKCRILADLVEQGKVSEEVYNKVCRAGPPGEI